MRQPFQITVDIMAFHELANHCRPILLCKNSWSQVQWDSKERWVQYKPKLNWQCTFLAVSIWTLPNLIPAFELQINGNLRAFDRNGLYHESRIRFHFTTKKFWSIFEICKYKQVKLLHFITIWNFTDSGMVMIQMPQRTV